MTILKAIPMALTPWFDDWVMSQVKQANALGSLVGQSKFGPKIDE